MATNPVFPLDLEREIFETAASMYPRTAPALLRVSRRVLIWIEPLLYRVLRLDRSWTCDAVRRAMQKKPASFFRDSVRHVLLRSSAAFSDKDTYALLGFCPGLVSFVVVGDLTSPALLPIIQWMPQIRKWGGSLKDLFGSYRAIDLSHPFFRAVTHLDIFDVFPNNDPRIYDQLAALPVCTHLCLNGNVAVEVLQRVLEQCPHLQVLVNLRHAEDKRVRATVPVPDMRLVVLIYRDYWSDWEVGARGGIDFWAAADAFVERKRRGDIDRSCYLLEHQTTARL